MADKGFTGTQKRFLEGLMTGPRPSVRTLPLRGRATSLVPESAPFDQEQRAWLNGFLAGLLGLGETREAGTLPAERGTPSSASALSRERRVTGRESSRKVLRELRRSVGPPSASAPTEAGRDAPGHALVHSTRRLVQGDEGTLIAEVVLDLRHARWRHELGATLALVPHNDVDLVRALLRAVGARGQELVVTPAGSREIWRCLLEDVDVTHVASETFALFESRATRQQAQWLSELDESARRQLDLLDLLERFPHARPGIDAIVATLPPLAPRLYAVASSPSRHATQAQLIVRLVRREQRLRERKGVASAWLAERVFRGDEIVAYRASNPTMQLPGDAPMVFVAKGVGLGRFKGLLDELQHRGRVGATWLVYAPLESGEEVLYGQELAAFQRAGVLEHLDVLSPPSRGRPGAPHELLRRRGRRLAAWLNRGAHLYFSGETQGQLTMLEDVVVDALCRYARMSRAQADEYVLSMRAEGRLMEEAYD